MNPTVSGKVDVVSRPLILHQRTNEIFCKRSHVLYIIRQSGRVSLNLSQMFLEVQGNVRNEVNQLLFGHHNVSGPNGHIKQTIRDFPIKDLPCSDY